jgi:hypothetical protein
MAFEKSEASVEPVETVVDHLYGFICVMMSTAMPVDCFRLFYRYCIAGDHIFSVHGGHPPTCVAASLHRCNACTQGLLHSAHTNTRAEGTFFKVNLPATLLDMKVHPKVQNLFNRCQVVFVVIITSPLACQLQLVFWARRLCCATAAFDRLLSGEVSSRG